MARRIEGRHVAAAFGAGFATIIAVNLVMATLAVRSFPGLETPNSYVASQVFDDERAAQSALGWTLEAEAGDGRITLAFQDENGRPVRPDRVAAEIGLPTSAAADRKLALTAAGAGYTAPCPEAGRWRLEVEALAADGTPWRQVAILRLDGRG